MKGSNNPNFGKDLTGSSNPNYKHGKGHCVKCGKELSDYNYELCRKCYLENWEINISKQQLIDLYITKKLSMAKIAKIFNCNTASIFNKLHKYNIRTRSKTENYIGKENPNWKGGLSNAPYPFKFNKVLKESIRIRDNHQCQICGIKEEDYWRKLDVHHIDYDKENLNPENLISLCNRCHMQTNGNRGVFQEYFGILMSVIK